MFTGIVEALGTVTAIAAEGSNVTFRIASAISEELKVDQSLSHNGVCLTVTHVENGEHEVSAVDETLQKTNLEDLVIGSAVNLERAMIANGRFDGHIVQGHVDGLARITDISDQQGSWLFAFELPRSHSGLMVEKGSICINGVSLTCFDVSDNTFRIAIIPYTYSNTSFSSLSVGDHVNVEFDILGKYVQQLTKSS